MYIGKVSAITICIAYLYELNCTDKLIDFTLPQLTVFTVLIPPGQMTCSIHPQYS